MIFTPDRGWIRLGPGLAALAFLATVPGAAAPGPADGFLRDARAGLARGDGIAAEAALRKALAAGAPRDTVAARMGEALLDQGDFDHAREWLSPGRFAPAEAAHGWRMLGRLELAARNLGASDAAFAKALALAPNDSELRVDMARLRYVAGQELAAVDLSDQAVRLDPANRGALELRGLLVRDAYGLEAALPWFEAGLKLRPDDMVLLGEYAATLGELGRTREMLVITRQMIRLKPRHPRAWVLQAMLAARAGDYALARQMLGRAGPQVLAMPAALLLSGVLELEAGDVNLAVERLDLLARRQPRNEIAANLLALTLGRTGNPALVIARFGEAAKAPGASPYLLTVVARALEDSGRRDLAAPLFDRAALAGAAQPRVIDEPTSLGVLALRYQDAPGEASAAIPYVRKLLAGGDVAGARQVAERIVGVAPLSASAQALAGDVRLVGGDLAGAVEAYRRAAGARLSDGLMLRLVEAYLRSGRGDAARGLVTSVLAGDPRNRTALRLAAGFAAEDGNWPVAADALGWLAATGSGRDVRLLADLAVARWRAGRRDGAAETARAAYGLQPAAPTATRALAGLPGLGGAGPVLMAKAARTEALGR